jgi:hypothetical protein
MSNRLVLRSVGRGAVVAPLVILLIAAGPLVLRGEVGGEEEPIRYVGPDPVSESDYVDGYHDGRLRPAIGTQNHQILRANRSHPEWSDGLGWTYNHGPNLAHWKGRFYVHYLATPVGEHIPPGATLLASSTDGQDWSAPRVLFPMAFWAEEHRVPEEVVHNLVMHQRMGFHVAQGGRLLAFGFYGIMDGHGMGRVVREVFEDGAFGPIHFIRPNDNWTKKLPYPLYTDSPDAGFVEACRDFLGDRIRRVQWWEEDRLAADAREFYGVPPLDDGDGPEPGQAFNFFTRPDGVVVGLFKHRWATLTRDGGRTWSAPVRIPTFSYAGAKIWAQRTDDGAYAAVYNPTGNASRYPLAVAVSPDGIHFDGLASVHGEVPPKRFWGLHKNPGPQYVRGIVEGNGDAPGDDLWVVYSVNKEDMWISRIPVPIRRTVEGPVADDFDDMRPGGVVTEWNVYSGRWTPVAVVAGTDGRHSLKLEDRDPYDYAKAVRVFGTADRQRVRFSVRVEALAEALEIDVTSGRGDRLVQLRLRADSRGDGIRLEWPAPDGPEGTALRTRGWHRIAIELDATTSRFGVAVDGEVVSGSVPFAASGGAPERIAFRTGRYRLADDMQKHKSGSPNVPGWDEPGADERADPTRYHLRDFRTEHPP